MSTSLIETSEEDSFIGVARYIAKLLNGEAKLNTSLASTPGGDLVEQTVKHVASLEFEPLMASMMKHVDLILHESESPNTECCLNVLCHLVARIETPSTCIKTALELCAIFASNTAHRPSVRVQAMLELFNTVDYPNSRHGVLLAVLKYAKEAGIHQLASSLHGKAEIWERQWDLSPSESMALFAAIAGVLDSHPSGVLKKEAFSLRTKVLLQCPSGDKAAIASLKPVAHEAVLAFLGSATQFSCDMFPSPAVQALKGDSKAGKAFELLDIMLAGDMKRWQASSFDTVLEELQGAPGAAKVELSDRKQDLADKMRMMALIVLCEAHEGSTVTFKEVETALLLDGPNAEAWLVRAFGKQLLDGRIDQVKETVHVRRCERRVFGKEDWTKLSNDLQTWKDNLKDIEVGMKENNLLAATSTVQRWLAA